MMCRLLVRPNSEVVAMGFIVQTDATTIYCVKLDNDIVRVKVKVILDSFACLPIPVSNEIFLVEHALGTFISWPKHLV